MIVTATYVADGGGDGDMAIVLVVVMGTALVLLIVRAIVLLMVTAIAAVSPTGILMATLPVMVNSMSCSICGSVLWCWVVAVRASDCSTVPDG